jgi:YesN/AraC family two-component response regulator
MSKAVNIIQRRELEPILHKAYRIAEHYTKAVNCAAFVIEPDWCINKIEFTNSVQFNSLCKNCTGNKGAEKQCSIMHMEAVKESKKLRGSNIYVCPAGLIFWISPFYSGERFAGALLSGGIQESEKNSNKVKALAQMMLICAEQISGMSFIQKTISPQLGISKPKYVKNILKSDNAACPIDMERMILASLRRGDNVDAKKILADLLNNQYIENRNNIQMLRLKAMELTVLLSRAVSNPKDIKDYIVMDTNIRYLKKIEECTNLQEITEILSVLADQMAGKIFSFHGVRHFTALRKAERYIWENYTRKISLQEIADASGLSAPYFSTIFKEEMGENLSSYLNRLRVEKAAAMLVATNKPISGVAAACGFEDQSWFSKIFKNNTGLTPGKYREQVSILG